MDDLIHVVRVEDRYYTKQGFNRIRGRVAELPMTVDYFNEVANSDNPKIYETYGVIIDDTDKTNSEV